MYAPKTKKVFVRPTTLRAAPVLRRFPDASEFKCTANAPGTGTAAIHFVAPPCYRRFCARRVNRINRRLELIKSPESATPIAVGVRLPTAGRRGPASARSSRGEDACKSTRSWVFYRRGLRFIDCVTTVCRMTIVKPISLIKSNVPSAQRNYHASDGIIAMGKGKVMRYLSWK